MSVLDLLDEIEEIVEQASRIPVVNKVTIDPNEILEIVKEIRIELPDEIQEAQYIRTERERIIDEAKAEYDKIIKTGEEKANQLVEADEITVRAKNRAEEITRVAKENSALMKMSILDYTDKMLCNLQEKMDVLYATYFTNMYDELQVSFNKINDNITSSRNEVREQIYKSQKDKEKDI